MDPFGDDKTARQYMLDAINEDTRANTTQPIAKDARTADSFLNMSGDADEEDDDFAPLPNQQQHVPVLSVPCSKDTHSYCSKAGLA